jgi:hypothetical protein
MGKIIANLQQSVDQTLPSTALMPTTNIIMQGMQGQGFGDDEIVGGFECRKETISGNGYADKEREMIMPALRDFLKGGIEMRQQKWSRGSGTSTALSVPEMLEHGKGHHPQSGG